MFNPVGVVFPYLSDQTTDDRPEKTEELTGIVANQVIDRVINQQAV